ncbi:hypothetical protein N7539_004944 [Penicillium diatomitis]|uniref:Myb-like domain-containing protein n=1 Tax=Penicillium diatomitis TaxID=2819901 RepID=A0A9W9X6G3_9EURO|nr:uncharacterized protein N7539_004944 [Penicillium diatomitis]KAJ5484956.1 hypothetical protein N7539_004944 [Penicillium diatomitis]
MKSFSSSVVNKSGKKFAPKAPPRRGAPVPAAPARRTSSAQQTPAQQTPKQQTPIQTANAQLEKETTASVPPSASPREQQTPAIAPPSEAVVSESATPAVASQSATPTSIPRPLRKPSLTKSTKIAPPASKNSSLATDAPDVPTSPRTLPARTSDVLPSIENEAPAVNATERIPLNETTLADAIISSSQASPAPRDVRNSDEAISPRQSISGPQASQSSPVAGKSLKWARKTSDFTNRGRGPLNAVLPPEPATTPNDAVGGTLISRSSVSNGAGRKRKASNISETRRESEKPKRRINKREPTPEGAEMVEILPNVVKMSELCKDLKTGKKSKRETELRRLELEELERKRKAQEEGSTTASVRNPDGANTGKTDRLAEPQQSASGPIMRIVNGEIVLDNASLEVDRHADAARAAGDLEDVVENQLTRKVNQATYGKRTKNESWNEEMTDLFYRGLRMFGTDFMVISKLFPGRSRRQIKLKFNNEERKDPQRIKDTLLGPRETIDIATYSDLTNQTYDDPKVIQQELQEEKKRIEEQNEKEKRMQEELLRNPTGADGDGNADPTSDKGNAANIKSKRKRNVKSAVGGGTEEVLGSIDDIPTA